MARKLRIQYPGAIYHVMNRGDHQERIFCHDEDRELFLASLAEGCRKSAFQIHGFCLMSNHFHLVVETPNANLVEGMKWLLGVYTSRFNRRHKVFGHLRAGMLRHIEEQRGKWHYGAELCESAEAKAERLIAAVLLSSS